MFRTLLALQMVPLRTTRRKKMEKIKVTCSFGNDECGLQTGTVKISELHDFKGHPFKVEQDIQLFELMRSIEDKGVLVPLMKHRK